MKKQENNEVGFEGYICLKITLPQVSTSYEVQNGHVLYIDIPAQSPHQDKGVTPGRLAATLPHNLCEFTQGADSGHRSPGVQGYWVRTFRTLYRTDV